MGQSVSNAVAGNDGDPCESLHLMRPEKVIFIPQRYNPAQAKYETQAENASCVEVEGAGVAFPLGMVHWDALMADWLLSVVLDAVNLFSQFNFSVALILDDAYKEVSPWFKWGFMLAFFLMIILQMIPAASFVWRSKVRMKLLEKIWKRREFGFYLATLLNFVLLRFFYQPNLVKDVKWWLANKAGEAPDHDTPILVARHLSTFKFESQAAWRVELLPSLLQNCILFGINLYVTFWVLGKNTSVSLFMAFVTFLSGARTIWRVFFVWLPTAKKHIESQERRIRCGDVKYTIPELNRLRKDPLLRFLNFALWRSTTWGPYPKACISFTLEGTECVALLFAKQPPHQHSHKIQYVTGGDASKKEEAIADEGRGLLTHLGGHDGNLGISYRVLQRPEER